MVWGALSRSLVVLSGSSDGAWSGLGSRGSWLEFSLGLRGAAQARFGAGLVWGTQSRVQAPEFSLGNIK